jgi:hypothetical protein
MLINQRNFKGSLSYPTLKHGYDKRLDTRNLTIHKQSKL